MRRAGDTDAWKKLTVHQTTLAENHTHIRDLFCADSNRCRWLTLQCGPLVADFSKHLLSRDTFDLLMQLAQERKLPSAINALFDGCDVNNTEQRPAMHAALRGHIPAQHPEAADAVHSTLAQMAAFVAAIHNGSWRGYSGQRITTIVNIGIGGSDLGPAMVTDALKDFHHSGIKCQYVSNLDPSHMRSALANCDAASTLFIVASKSFGTLETLCNAKLARQWYLDQGGDQHSVYRHFVAVSSNVDAAKAFGIHPDNIFPMRDWVGGRYSLWSAIGLSIALATSMDTFRELLSGAAEMDRHFLQTPPEHNIPVVMGLLAIWYRNFWQCQSLAILPYAQNLALFPAFLQQLEMESLGKSVDADGNALGIDSGAVIWGAAGTNGQHSFHQMLHQGTAMVPADFVAVARPLKQPGLPPERQAQQEEQHQHLLANCLAQSRALMVGKSADEALGESLTQGVTEQEAQALAHHRQVPGNRPSTTLLLQQLDARNLGCLIALYEHKVYVQSVILGINAFDQWGVEIGKQLSAPLFQTLSGQDASIDLDASTRSLLNLVRAANKDS